MGLFRRKAKEMGVHIKQTEPHSPWQNAAELAIRELKKGAGRNDRIPSTTPGAEPPRDARDSGSARSHSTHLETSSSD